MMEAASSTPKLCSKSPSTWMNAALTLVLLCSSVRPWPWEWRTGDWWRMKAKLIETHIKHWTRRCHFPTNTTNEIKQHHSQDVNRYSTCSCDHHDVTVYLIIITDDPLNSKQNKNHRHSPDGENRQKSP